MTVYGVLPMAGKGSRLQPIAFSKELYPVAFNNKHFAISEFNIRSMVKSGVQEIKLVVAPEKIDIAKYYANTKYPVSLYFHASRSLPESCLFPIGSMRDEDICLFGLPDTLFSPPDGFKKIKLEIEHGADICLGTFKVNDGSKYDSVSWGKGNQVSGVKVKQNPPLSNWIWGIWGGKVKALKKLRAVINKQRNGRDEKLLGIGFNELATSQSVDVRALKLGEHYFDIGTMDAVVNIGKVISNFQF